MAEIRDLEQRNKEAEENIQRILREGVGEIEVTPMFQSFKDRKDQKAVWGIYLDKMRHGLVIVRTDEEKIAAIEKVAQQYYAQKCAFQDILTKQGFELEKEVQRDDSGRI